MIKICEVCNTEFESIPDIVYEFEIHDNCCDKCMSKIIQRFNYDENFRNLVFESMREVVHIKGQVY